jgi:hypothetical protein
MNKCKAWFWCDASGQAWLSTGYKLYGPACLPDESALVALRPGASVHAVLPATLAEPFVQPDWQTLVLDTSLPSAWHRLDWEALSVHGQPLHQVCNVIRLAPPPAKHTDALLGRVLVVTLLSDSDLVQLAVNDLLADQRLGTFSRWGSPQSPERLAQEWYAGRDLSAEFSDLVLFAHGGESDQLQVLDAQGQPWLDESTALPRLPPRVWLFVCSDRQGNLTPLVQRLLQHGARQVLYGHGKLEAHRMVDVFTSWLAMGSTELTGGIVGVLGNNTLRLAGCVSLPYPDQLTLEHDQQTGDDPIKRLKVSPLDLSKQKKYLDDMGTAVDQCWPRTQNWLLPFLAYMSERQQDQASRLRYQRLWETLDDQVRHISPATAYFLASTARRDGLYVQQVRYLNQVLKSCQGMPAMAGFVFDTWLSMANVWIDMNLPQQGATMVQKLDLWVDQLPSGDVHAQKIKLLDVKARLAMRQGHGNKALSCYDYRLGIESQDATWNNTNAARVFAASLYAAALMQHVSADDRAKQCLDILESIAMEGRAYLCRALAVYCWRYPQGVHHTSARRACETWLNSEFVKTNHLDCGPPAVTTAAFLLCPLASLHPAQLLGQWNGCWQVGLEEQRYWFELSCWSALLHNLPAARQALERFHAQRLAVVDEIDNLMHLQSASLHTECQERQSVEAHLMLAPEPNFEDWLKQGCVPL